MFSSNLSNFVILKKKSKNTKKNLEIQKKNHHEIQKNPNKDKK